MMERFAKIVKSRGGSRAAATSKMKRFVVKVNAFQPLTIVTKRSILDVVAILEPSLKLLTVFAKMFYKRYLSGSFR